MCLLMCALQRVVLIERSPCQVIHIKRFKVEPDGTCTKLCCAVHFPEVLRLSPDTLPTPPPEFGVGVRLPPPLGLTPGDSCAHKHYKKRTVSAAPPVVASSASPSRQTRVSHYFDAASASTPRSRAAPSGNVRGCTARFVVLLLTHSAVESRMCLLLCSRKHANSLNARLPASTKLYRLRPASARATNRLAQGRNMLVPVVLVLVLVLVLLWSSQTKLPASTASLQWSGHARHARS